MVQDLNTTYWGTAAGFGNDKAREGIQELSKQQAHETQRQPPKASISLLELKDLPLE